MQQVLQKIKILESLYNIYIIIDFSAWLDSIGMARYASNFEGRQYQEIVEMMYEDLEEEVSSILDQWPSPPSMPPAGDDMHPPIE